jgi:hypothetical protein
MFRAFSFVLAVVLCTTGWSTAHAAPKAPFVGALSKTMKGGYLLKDSTIHLNTPFKSALPFNGAYEKDKIKLPSLRDVTVFFGGPITFHALSVLFSGNNHKDSDRNGAH